MKGGRANELENGRNGRTVVAVHQIFFTLSRPPFFSIPPSLVYTVTLSLFFFTSVYVLSFTPKNSQYPVSMHF